MLGVLLVIGLGAAGSWSNRALLLAPVVPTLAGVMIIGIQPRYLVPMAPFLTLTVGAGLAWLGAAESRPRRMLGID